MPDSFSPARHHWVLPFAACASDEWLPAVKAMPSTSFHHFGKLLQGMKEVHSDRGDVYSLSPPHERVQARALGLPATDGLIPWAAWQQLKATEVCDGKAWAYITPCHWAMGRELATMTDPAALGLQENESRTLLAAMQPYFETYGVTLHYSEPTRWLAEGELFRNLPSASLDRVLGRNVAPWLPGAGSVAANRFGAGPPQAEAAPSEGSVLHDVKSVGASAMRLLQNEMQMLLYTHTVNDARAASRQPAVNSFWISGSGALPENFSPKPQADVVLSRSLAQAAFIDNWAAYAQAWAALDAGEAARLLALQQGGETVRLSLCGERHAVSFETTKTGIFSRMTKLFSPQPLPAVLEQL
ncbi:hypothetical protein [Polaromonas sp.]|uniref:hypothetical protein n=1 Tax=Polaromonas sp. TaxID=1869339 RepID=UPI0032664C55